MERGKPQSSEAPVLNVLGERVALGPLRADLLPLYGRWINDLGTIRMMGLPPGPVTAEKERDWYEGRASRLSSAAASFPGSPALRDRSRSIISSRPARRFSGSDRMADTAPHTASSSPAAGWNFFASQPGCALFGPAAQA